MINKRGGEEEVEKKMMEVSACDRVGRKSKAPHFETPTCFINIVRGSLGQL